MTAKGAKKEHIAKCNTFTVLASACAGDELFPALHS